MLRDVRVVSVGSYISAPLASRLLGDLGANVVKVEHVDGGDAYRYLNHQYDEDTPPDLTHRFVQYNRGKQSVAVDLGTGEGREIFKTLAASSEVLVENLRPGKMEEFGLGYETLRDVSDELVYCSISGYGNTGTNSDRGAMDASIQANSGLIHQNSADAGRPVYSGLFWADIATGLYTTISVLSSLLAKSNGEGGTYVDVSMLESVVSLFNHEVAEYSATDTAPPRIRASGVPYGVYETSNGFLCLNVPKSGWESFCEGLGLDVWLQTREYHEIDSRIENEEEIDRRLKRVFRTEPTEHWLDALKSTDVLISSVNTVDEMFGDEQLRRRGTIRETEVDPLGTITQLAFPVNFSNYQVSESLTPPRLGEHTREVLAEMGYSDDEIESFRRDGVVATADRRQEHESE